MAEVFGIVGVAAQLSDGLVKGSRRLKRAYKAPGQISGNVEYVRAGAGILRDLRGHFLADTNSLSIIDKLLEDSDQYIRSAEGILNSTGRTRKLKSTWKHIRRGRELDETREELCRNMTLQFSLLSKLLLQSSSSLLIASINETSCYGSHNSPLLSVEMNGLAIRRLWSERKWAESLNFAAFAVDLLTKKFGAKDFRTLTTRSDMALCLKRTGQSEKWQNTTREVASLRETVLGISHPDTLASLNNLAILEESLHKFAKAETIYRKMLAVQEEHAVLPASRFMSLRQNLAIALELQGGQTRYREAEMHMIDVIQWRRANLGSDSPDVFVTESNLGTLLYIQKRYPEALEAHTRVYEWRRINLTADHPDTVNSLSNRALVIQAMDQTRIGEAVQIWDSVVSLNTGIFGRDHPETLKARRNQSIAKCRMKTSPEAPQTSWASSITGSSGLERKLFRISNVDLPTSAALVRATAGHDAPGPFSTKIAQERPLDAGMDTGSMTVCFYLVPHIYLLLFCSIMGLFLTKASSLWWSYR